MRINFFGSDDQALQSYMANVLASVSVVGPQQRTYGNAFIAFVSRSQQPYINCLPVWVGRQQQHNHRSIQALVNAAEKPAEQQQQPPSMPLSTNTDDVIDHSGSPVPPAKIQPPTAAAPNSTDDDDVKSHEYVTLLAHDPRNHIGYCRVQLSTALGWFIHLFGMQRTPSAQRFDSITQLPRAVMRPIIEQSLSADVASKFVHAVCTNMLTPTSLDRNGWWYNACALRMIDAYLFPSHQMTVYYEDSVALNICSSKTSTDEQQPQDLHQQSTLAMRHNVPDIVPMDAPAHQPGATINPEAMDALSGADEQELYHARSLSLIASAITLPHGSRLVPPTSPLAADQVAILCYLYLAYSFVNPCMGAPWRTTQQFVVDGAVSSAMMSDPLTLTNLGIPWQASDSAHVLYPIFASMVAGAEIDPRNNAALVQLYMRDSGATYRRLSELAEDVRTLLLSDVLSTDAVPNHDEANLLTQSKRALLRHLSTEADVLARTLRVPRVHKFTATNRRHATVPLSRQPFGEFVHSLDRQMLPTEQKTFYDWVQHQLTRVVAVDIDELLTARKLRDAKIHDDAAQVHTRARELFDAMRRYDREVVVMRFPLSGCGADVTLEQFRTSLDLYIASEPELLQRALWYTGSDMSGLYFVTERRQYTLLTQTMLTATVTAKAFRHNVCLFPLLARFYFTRYQSEPLSDASESTTAAEVPTPMPLPVESQEERILKGDPLSHDPINEHALSCCVAVLCHWLGIEPVKTAVKADTSNHSEAFATGGMPRASAEGVFTQQFHGVPRRGSANFIRLRTLHRFVRYLEQLSHKPFAGPPCVTNAIVEAVSGFLEMERKRRISYALATRVRDAYLNALQHNVNHNYQYQMDSLSDQIAASPVETDYVDLSDPWCVYFAALHGLVSAEDATALFLEGGLIVLERPPRTLATLRKSCAIPEAHVIGDKVSTSEYANITHTIAATYNRMFVVPFAASERVVDCAFEDSLDSFVELAHLIRQLETLVAPAPLADAMKSDFVRGFDFSDLLIGRSPFAMTSNDADSIAMPPPAARVPTIAAGGAAAAVQHHTDEDSAAIHTHWRQRSMRSDGRSILPFGFVYIGAENSHRMIFFERHFSVLSFVGGTYAEQLIERGTPLHVAQREVYHCENTLYRALQQNRDYSRDLEVHLESVSHATPKKMQERLKMPATPAAATPVPKKKAQELPEQPQIKRHKPHGIPVAPPKHGDDNNDVGQFYAKHELTHDQYSNENRYRLVRSLNLALVHAQLFEMDTDRLRLPAHRTLRRMLVHLREMANGPQRQPDDETMPGACGLLYSMAADHLHMLHVPLVISVHQLPFRFTDYMAMGDFVARCIRIPLMDEREEDYFVRINTNALDRTSNYCNILNSMAALYAVCGAVVRGEDVQMMTSYDLSYVNDSMLRINAEFLSDEYARVVGQIYRSGALQAVVTRDS